MNLTTEIFGDAILVHTPSELNAGEAGGLRDFLSSQEQVNVIVDLDGTELISSEGLAALLDAQEQLRQRLGDLKVTTSNTVNRKILEITRLDQRLDVYTNVVDAMKGCS